MTPKPGHGAGGGEPLDRFLCRTLRLPAAEVRRRVQWGRVAVDGERCHYYHWKLAPGQAVTMDGAPVADRPDDTLLVMHKPTGVACSHDPEEGPLVYDLVPERFRHPDLHTCGRLDRNTTGLLLVTFDGKVMPKLMEPRRKAPKRYRVVHDGVLAADAVAQAAGGMTLADDPRPLLPAELTIDSPDRCTLVLHEGRHHQVKRMIRDWGGRVTALHRDRIGDLELPPDLAPGELRPITLEERTALGL